MQDELYHHGSGLNCCQHLGVLGSFKYVRDFAACEFKMQKSILNEASRNGASAFG